MPFTLDHLFPFTSLGLTGDGSEQSIAHGLGLGAPDVVIVQVRDSSTATYIQGTHTGSVIKVTVTNGKTYDVFAGYSKK